MQKDHTDMLNILLLQTKLLCARRSHKLKFLFLQIELPHAKRSLMLQLKILLLQTELPCAKRSHTYIC